MLLIPASPGAGFAEKRGSMVNDKGRIQRLNRATQPPGQARDDWEILSDLLRALGVVKLPAGKHRLLLRGRGASALFVDGKLIAKTPFPPAGTDNKPIKAQDDYLDLGGDFLDIRLVGKGHPVPELALHFALERHIRTSFGGVDGGAAHPLTGIVRKLAAIRPGTATGRSRSRGVCGSDALLGRWHRGPPRSARGAPRPAKYSPVQWPRRRSRGGWDGMMPG